jgi:hypothetical protein
MEYQWDQAKAAANLKKHGVAFSDAALALEDPHALTIADPCNGRIEVHLPWRRSQRTHSNHGVCATWPRNTHNLFAKGQPF